jgi:hypothetical protein
MEKYDLKILDELDMKQSEVADLLGTERQEVSRGIKQQKKYFDLEKLAKIFGGCSRSNEKWMKCRMPDVRKLFLRYLLKTLGMTKTELIHHLESIDFIGLPNQGFLVVVYTETTGDKLINHFIRKRYTSLVIAADSNIRFKAKSIIELWAYSYQGNYQDKIEIKLVGLEHPPIMGMVGGYKNGAFHGFADVDKGFVSLDHPELAFLKGELEALSQAELPEGASLSWSMPVSPEARIIEHVIRHPEASLSEEVSGYLRQQQQRFEEESGDSTDLPLNRLSQSLPGEIAGRFGTEAADIVQTTLMRLKLVTS